MDQDGIALTTSSDDDDDGDLSGYLRAVNPPSRTDDGQQTRRRTGRTNRVYCSSRAVVIVVVVSYPVVRLRVRSCDTYGVNRLDLNDRLLSQFDVVTVHRLKVELAPPRYKDERAGRLSRSTGRNRCDLNV